MYDEIKKDLQERSGEPIPRKAPLWGKAIKSFLVEKSDTSNPIPVSWLAKKTGMNEKNLHNIIAGRVRDPSSDKLVKIAGALGISLSALADRAMSEDDGNFSVCKFGDRFFIEYPQHGFAIQSFTPPARSRQDFFWGKMTIKPFLELKRWQFRENLMVGIFVESGTLEITYGNKKRMLHANQSAYFDAGVTHKIKNIDSIEAKLFIVTSPSIL